MSLAALQPAEGPALLLPLLQHPDAVVRYDAALALTVLDRAEAATAVQQLLRDMETGSWPRQIHDLPLPEARATLAARVERLWGPVTTARPFAPTAGPALPEFPRHPRPDP